MNKKRNKATLPQISVGEQPNAMSGAESSSAQLKASPSQQPIHDFPHQDPIGASCPTHNEIEMRAYEIFVEEGRPQGQSDEIWRRAELEQRSKNVAPVHPNKRR